jgi:hypothetical protein
VVQGHGWLAHLCRQPDDCAGYCNGIDSCCKVGFRYAINTLRQIRSQMYTCQQSVSEPHCVYVYTLCIQCVQPEQYDILR